MALNSHEFLVDERDGNGLGGGGNAIVKQVFKIDLAGATDVTSITDPTQLNNAAVTKSTLPVLDIVSVLNANGIPSDQIPSKIEGLAFGQDVDVNGVIEHTLWVSNDNDFTPADSGPNDVFVFGFTDADLNGSVFGPQIVPEPGSAMLFSVGVIALFCRGRRK